MNCICTIPSTTHLYEGLEIEGVETPVVPVGLAGVAGDGHQLPHQQATHQRRLAPHFRTWVTLLRPNARLALQQKQKYM